MLASSSRGSQLLFAPRRQQMLGGDQLFIDHAREAALLAVFALHSRYHYPQKTVPAPLIPILAHYPLDSKAPL